MNVLGRIVLGGVAAIVASVSIADQVTEGAVVLNHNPFERPSLVAPSVAGGQELMEGESMVLRATLIDEAGSLANINGLLFRQGDEIAGYAIVSIGEGVVTLSRNDQLRILSVDGNE